MSHCIIITISVCVVCFTASESQRAHSHSEEDGTQFHRRPFPSLMSQQSSWPRFPWSDASIGRFHEASQRSPSAGPTHNTSTVYSRSPLSPAPSFHSSSGMGTLYSTSGMSTLPGWNSGALKLEPRQFQSCSQRIPASFGVRTDAHFGQSDSPLGHGHFSQGHSLYAKPHVQSTHMRPSVDIPGRFGESSQVSADTTNYPLLGHSVLGESHSSFGHGLLSAEDQGLLSPGPSFSPHSPRNVVLGDIRRHSVSGEAQGSSLLSESRRHTVSGGHTFSCEGQKRSVSVESEGSTTSLPGDPQGHSFPGEGAHPVGFRSGGEISAGAEEFRSPSGNFCCPLCQYSVPNENQLSDHMRAVHKKSMCISCNKVFNSFASLCYHRNVKHGHSDHLKCEICGKFFGHKQHMRSHMTSVHKDYFFGQGASGFS